MSDMCLIELLVKEISKCIKSLHWEIDLGYKSTFAYQCIGLHAFYLSVIYVNYTQYSRARTIYQQENISKNSKLGLK